MMPLPAAGPSKPATRRVAGALLLAAFCATILYAHVYVEFERLRFKVVESEQLVSGGATSVALPDLRELAGQTSVIIINVRNDAPQPRQLAVLVDGVELGRFVAEAGRVSRIDLSVATGANLIGGERFVLSGPGEGWSMQSLEIGNAHGFSRGLLSFVIVPRAALPGRTVHGAVAVLLFAALFALAMLAPALPLSKVARISRVVLAGIATVLFGAALLSPMVSQFKVLFALHSFVLCVVLLYAPQVFFVLCVVLLYALQVFCAAVWAGDKLRFLANERAFGYAGCAIVLVFFALPLFRGLNHSDVGNDEAIYSYAVDRILETGSWLTPESIPHANRPGDPGAVPPGPFLEKPPLKFWIVAAPIKLGLLPHNEFGLRFWDALFGALAFVYVFLIGRRLVGSVCGVAAVFLLFIQWRLLFSHGLRANVMEAPLVVAYCGSIYHFLVWSGEQRSSRPWAHVSAIAAWFTLGFMTKFMAAIFLPLVVGLAALLSTASRRRLWSDRWYFAAATLGSVALIAPWFVYQHLQRGAEFWNVILGIHVIERFTSSVDPEHIQPWSYYFSELRIGLEAAGILGWVTWGTVLWAIEAYRRRSMAWTLIVFWFFIPVGLISFGTSKLYHYIYPFLPALALCGGCLVSVLARLTLGKPSGLEWPDAFLKKRIAAPVADLAGEWFGAGGAGAVQRLVGLGLSLVLILYAWPMAQYGAVLETTDRIDKPMRVARDCVLDQYQALRATAPGTRSKIYVHLPPGLGLTHNYYYYYRALDEWEQPEEYDDAFLESRLFMTGDQTPTLIIREEYDRFLQRIGGADSLRQEPPGFVRLGLGAADTRDMLLLLPGPFAVCVEPGVSAGG
jgi:hypothetical protein